MLLPPLLFMGHPYYSEYRSKCYAIKWFVRTKMNKVDYLSLISNIIKGLGNEEFLQDMIRLPVLVNIMNHKVGEI